MRLEELLANRLTTEPANEPGYLEQLLTSQKPTAALLANALAQASAPMWRATIMPNGAMRTFPTEGAAREWIQTMGAKPGAGAVLQPIMVKPRVPGQ